MLPGLGGGKRVPAWVVGEREVRRVPHRGEGDGGAGRYEDLRRRLEGEVVAASGSGSRNGGDGDGSADASGSRLRRGGGGGGFVDRLRGVF